MAKLSRDDKIEYYTNKNGRDSTRQDASLHNFS